MTTSKLFNLLTAVNFDLDTAIAANAAIGDVSQTEVLKELHSEQVHIMDIEKTLIEGLDRQYTVNLRSFNDGNNVYDEYVKIVIKNGVPSFLVCNSSYCPAGYEITTNNVNDNLDNILTVVKELKSIHNDCSVLFLGALTEKAELLNDRQMLDMINKLFNTNI